LRLKSSDQPPDWVKIPSAMQYQFFELAEKEAKRTKTRLIEDRKKLHDLRKHLQFQKIPEDDSWKDWRIGVVDGSDSPVMSERIGGRFGTYGATYHIFQGLELVEEEYFSGSMVDFQTGGSDISQKLLSVYTAGLERDVALLCLKQDVDLLMIDGSFFGFRPRCRLIHHHPISSEEFNDGVELVKHVRDASTELLKCGKAVGIIKRIQTASFDGWSIYREGNSNSTLQRNDKDILTSLLKADEWFSYETTYGDPILYSIFSRLAAAYNLYARTGRTIETILKFCKNDVYKNIERDLLCEPEEILRTSRYFVRCRYPAPPFCFETPLHYKLDPLLSFFNATCNEATGLPMFLDLTDQDITIPAGLTREFLEEIEAHLIKETELDAYEVETHFASLNPQKEE
jgi:hypothetical protein